MAFIKRLYRLLIIPYLDTRQKPSFSIFLSEYRKKIKHNTHFLVKKLNKYHMYLNIINTLCTKCCQPVIKGNPNRESSL